MPRYYRVVLKIEDNEELVSEEDIEAAIEDTLEYLPYNLVGSVREIETDEDQ